MSPSRLSALRRHPATPPSSSPLLAGPNAFLRLTQVGDHDWVLELGLNDGGVVVRTPYSRFSPISLSRPWVVSDHPQPLEVVLVDSTCDALMVVSHSPLFEVVDRFEIHGEYHSVRRRWKCVSSHPLEDVALGTAVCAGNGIDQHITIPHVLYNNNPSASPERLVPRLSGAAGEALVVEDHRLPIPGANVEWREDHRHVSLTMLVRPDMAPTGAADSPECGSLGVILRSPGVELVSLSGVVAFNGKADRIYGKQNESMASPVDGYMRMTPGQTYEKTIDLKLSSHPKEGRGYQSLTKGGWDLLRPEPAACFGLDTTIKLKLNALRERWRDCGDRKGFMYLPEPGRPGNIYSYPPSILYGWTGQAMKLGWCALKASVGGFDDAPWREMGMAVLDHFASAPSLEGQPGCQLSCQTLEDGRWFGMDWGATSSSVSSRALGETLTSLADCLILLNKHGIAIQPQWRLALKKGMDFLTHARLTDGGHGIFPALFRAGGCLEPADHVPSAGGITCVTAILAAAEVLNDPSLIDRARILLDRYARIYTHDFRRPFNGATLDASCEDKEAGLFHFLANARAFALTKDRHFAEQAELAADWTATFIYHWNVPMRPGTCLARENFHTAFWPGVSVQNHHLDVFHAPYELYEFAREVGNDRLEKIALGMMRAWTHGIAQYPGHWGYDIPGEQAEQLFQTNFMQGPGGPELWRGGANPWNPSWIIANVLEAALKFKSSPAGSSL